MDILSRVLNTLEFNSSFYFSVRLWGSWGAIVPNYPQVARFHVCYEGSSLFRIEDVEEIISLNKGDILIIPHGASHTLLSDINVKTERLDDLFVRSNYNGSKFLKLGDEVGPNHCRLLCGHFEFNHSIQHPFIDQLPSYILLKESETNELAWLHQALKLYTQEEQLSKLGNSLIVKHLSEIIFSLAVQFWQRSQDKPEGFIAATADAHLSKALFAFHEKPSNQWRVEDLARAAGMSRTSFNEEFTNTVKMPPGHYVTLWRMNLAQNQLRTTMLSISKLAEECGYESVTAFSKAFKRFTGQTPKQFRDVYIK